MGIKGFASRIRPYGSMATIGRKGDSCNDRAVIDGPSLAHSLLYQNSEIVADREGGIFPRFNYGEIGKAAIDWLQTLETYGFAM